MSVPHITPNVEISIPVECELVDDAKQLARAFEDWYLLNRTPLFGERAPTIGVIGVLYVDPPPTMPTLEDGRRA